MSAFGTVDRQDQLAFQKTFPTIFAQHYDMPYQYAPTSFAEEILPEGRDFQAHWHRQKQMDAHRRVMNGVRDTRHSTARALASRYGYFGMPEAHLGQRVFANPSYGAQMSESARRDQNGPFRIVEAGMEGGVLRTSMGQQWARDRLAGRIRQLNRIDDEEAMMTQGQPLSSISAVSRGVPAEIGETAKIEFNIIRQRVIDALESGLTTEIALGDIGRMLQLLFRYAPSATPDELADIWQSFTGNGGLMQLVLQLNDDDYDPPNESQFNEQVALTMKTVLEKAKDYVQGMIAGENFSPREKLALSKALLKQLKFTSVFRFANLEKNPLDVLRDARSVGALSRREEQRLEDFDGDDADFDRPAPTREDSMARVRGNPRYFLDTDTRQRFGQQSGAFLGEDAPRPSTSANERGYEEEADVLVGEEVDEEARPVRGVLSSESVARRSVAPSESSVNSGTFLPRSRAELDRIARTREDYDALARRINASGGINGRYIQVYARSSVQNIRRNFIKRLGL